jgi:TolB-like protein
MICSTSSSSERTIPRVVLVLLLASGCALLNREGASGVESESILPAPPSPGAVHPIVTRDTPIALLPIENLSGERAPVEVAEQWIRERLEQNGFHLIEEKLLDAFMHRYRIRAASGLTRDESRAIEAVTGASAVLVTSLAAHRKWPPPEISLFSRLVSSGEQPEILWMDSVGLSGEDGVRLLGIGRMREPRVLLEKVVHRLTGSLVRSLPDEAPGGSLPDATATQSEEMTGPDAPPPDSEDAVDPRIPSEPDGGSEPSPAPSPSASEPEGESSSPGEASPRYAPKSAFRSPFADPHRTYSVAVIPFVNVSERKNAGKIMMLHFVEELSRIDSLRVVDPGLVREEMLRYRTVIPEGPSLATASLLSSNHSLGIDLLLSGTVFDYGAAEGDVPTVDFGLEIIDAANREIVWRSRSQNDGGEGVFFLDVGRVYTAHRLATDMARAAVWQLVR